MEINTGKIFKIFKDNTDNLNYTNFYNDRIEKSIGNRTFHSVLLGDYIDLKSHSNLAESEHKTLTKQYKELDKYIIGDVNNLDNAGSPYLTNFGLINYIKDKEDIEKVGDYELDTQKKYFSNILEKCYNLRYNCNLSEEDIVLVITNCYNIFNLLRIPYHTSNIDINNTPEKHLLKENIKLIDFNNIHKKENNDKFIIITSPKLFTLYYGLEPQKVKECVIDDVDSIQPPYKRIWYGYNNPFIVPKVFGSNLGYYLKIKGE
jgi:hypothetical protein